MNVYELMSVHLHTMTSTPSQADFVHMTIASAKQQPGVSSCVVYTTLVSELHIC